ncbi:MAG: DUF402 domain-containing protein [Mycobacteriales bacterium]
MEPTRDPISAALSHPPTPPEPHPHGPSPTGGVIVVQERWRGQLWSAAPHRVVECADRLVTFLAAGSITVHATNRGLPVAAGMTRSERKLEALRTGVHTVTEHREPWSSLHFFTPGCWARVSQSWDDAGHIVGHYVNFETPYEEVDDGVVTMDLALDALVRGHRWEWKDLDDLDAAIRIGIFEAGLRSTLMECAGEVRRWVEKGEGPFAPAWKQWRPNLS